MKLSADTLRLKDEDTGIGLAPADAEKTTDAITAMEARWCLVTLMNLNFLYTTLSGAEPQTRQPSTPKEQCFGPRATCTPQSLLVLPTRTTIIFTTLNWSTPSGTTRTANRATAHRPGGGGYTRRPCRICRFLFLFFLLIIIEEPRHIRQIRHKRPLYPKTTFWRHDRNATATVWNACAPFYSKRRLANAKLRHVKLDRSPLSIEC